MRITAETCPHYLRFAAEEVPDGATEFKCCPPIRDAANRERCGRRCADGAIDCVVSDHSPCTADLKRLDTGDFGAAWGGIASLQLGLPVVWTEARERGHRARPTSCGWMAAAPGRRWPGWPARARSRSGDDADLVAFAPDEAFVVDPARLHHRNPVTPYAGRTLTGVVRDDLAARRSAVVPDGTSRRSRAGRLLTEGPPMTDFTDLPDLASRALGGSVVRGQRRVLRRAREPDHGPSRRSRRHTFGHKGKVYDGWETRRRREPGHDWAIVRLGVPGRGARRRRRHRVLHRQLPAATSRSRRRASRATRAPTSCAAPTGSRWSPRRRAGGDTANAFAVDRPTGWSPTSG